jgi:hypothetical protein
MAKKHAHRIGSAYDAWWFLYYHPKFCLRARNEISREKADDLEKRGFIVTRDRAGDAPGEGGKCWREWRHLLRHAIEENLSIFYAKVDASGKVNDDASLNTVPECWLEFGSMEYGYPSQWHDETQDIPYHDPSLDCGGATFDMALVALAKGVRRRYGDYKDRRGEEGTCGRPACADCEEITKMQEARMRQPSSSPPLPS